MNSILEKIYVLVENFDLILFGKYQLVQRVSIDNVKPIALQEKSAQEFHDLSAECAFSNSIKHLSHTDI